MTHLVVNVLLVVALVAIGIVLFRRKRKGRPFRGSYSDLTRRGSAHLTSLVNEGVVSVDDLLHAFHHELVDGATAPEEAEQVLLDIAEGCSSGADADEIRRHLDQIHH